MCDLSLCETENQGVLRVYENIGDGSFACSICENCAYLLGLREGDDLPDPYEVVKILGDR